MAKHYIEVDLADMVVHGFSDEFEQPAKNAICICEDGGRHFELNGVINPPLVDYCGVPLYRFDGKKVVRRTQSEIESHITPHNPDAPSIEDRTSALESALLELILGGAV